MHYLRLGKKNLKCGIITIDIDLREIALECQSRSVLSYSLPTPAIEERAHVLGLFETLKTLPEDFYEHMAKYVYPTIEGRDHQRLLYYFTLLENYGSSKFMQHGVKPETHVRLLRKFKAVAPGTWC